MNGPDAGVVVLPTLGTMKVLEEVGWLLEVAL
jgi:hypothetical protein